jgi:hypothetical protein
MLQVKPAQPVRPVRPVQSARPAPRPVPRPVPSPTLKEVNSVPLTRKVLKEALKDLSERLYHSFRRQVRLVVHGGAVMVLYPHFNHREFTQDVDYIHRSFETEYRALGFANAGERLRRCVAETAYKFKLGADWMNDHADVALPMAYECVFFPKFCFVFFNLTDAVTLKKLQSHRPHVRPDLHRIHRGRKRFPANDFQRARSPSRSRSVVVGPRSQTGALREERPGRLRRGPPSRL